MIRYEMTVPGWSDETYYSWEGEGPVEFESRVLGSFVERYPGAWCPGVEVRVNFRYINPAWGSRAETYTCRRRAR